jgi:hypothetical protein
MGIAPQEHQVDTREAAAEFERHRAHLTGVAYRMLGVAARYDATSRISVVNGSAGLVFEAGGGVGGVMGFTVAGDLITEIDFVVNPEKLERVTHRR